MFAETMFIKAIGAFPGLRAQYIALSFSGNSDRNGATHWMNRYSETPRVTANRSRLGRKGSGGRYRRSPPPTNRAEMEAICPRRDRRMMRRGIASRSPISSDSLGGTFLRTHRYRTYITIRTP